MNMENKYITPSSKNPVYQIYNTYSGYDISTGLYKQWEIKKDEVWMTGDTCATTLTDAIRILHDHIITNIYEIHPNSTFHIEMLNGEIVNREISRIKCYSISMKQAVKFGLIKSASFKSTAKNVDKKSLNEITKMAMKALKNIEECEQGTIKNPVNLASSVLKDGRTLIQTITEDGYVRYNDGWFVVEVDSYRLYVDITSSACIELGYPLYPSDIND